MKQDKTGRYKVVLKIEPLRVMVGAQGDYVESTVPFMMETTVYWEPRIRSTEDEAGCDEYLEVISARTFVPLALQGKDGISLVIQPSVNIVNLLSEEQYRQLIDLVYAQQDFHVY